MKRSTIQRKHRRVTLLSALLLGCVATGADAGILFPKVTNTNDSGAGSLRQAILDANNNGADGAIVEFNIGSSCGPHVIHVTTQLPDPRYVIDFLGYTQPGASANTLELSNANNAVICIVIAGDNKVTDGLAVASSVADATSLSVEAQRVQRVTHSALNLRGGSAHQVLGIRTGGVLGGFQMEPNEYGVILAAGVHDVTIGGSDIRAFNQLADITNNAIYIASGSGSTSAANNNSVFDNNIGFIVDKDAKSTSLPTGGAGIFVGGYQNSFIDNEIDSSGASGIHLNSTDAHDNLLDVEFIYYSSGDGVLVDDDAHDNNIYNNFIYDSNGDGVRVVNGQGNSIRANNMGNNAFGIDLAGQGVTPNDNDSAPSLPDLANRGQNFPVLTLAAGGHFSGKIGGSLTTTPGTYQIDFYETAPCDPSGYGQGVVGVFYPNNVTGEVTVPGGLTVGGQNTVSFSFPVTFDSYYPGGVSITATATDAVGNTSEYSACFPYTDDTIFFDNFEHQ